MRDLWYADQRDLVKWATLAHLVRKHEVRRILQVPYWREEEPPEVRFGDSSFAVPGSVWGFFRDLRLVHGLGERIGAEVEVYSEPFDHGERGAYLEKLLPRITRDARSVAVLLDPDTGLEPTHCSIEHTTVKELEAVWRSLRGRDWLVLYQHASRDRKWREAVEHRMSASCPGGRLQIALSRQVGKDVALLCMRKE